MVVRTPLDFDARDPDFPRQCRTWSLEMQSEIAETVARTAKDVAISRAMINRVDRILARRG